MASLEEYYPQALDICLKHQLIENNQYDEAMRQFKIERDAGLFYLIGFNRDIVTHFMSALGVHYPSTQPVQNALKRLLNELGIKADDIFK